jgi:hypothetical protein
MVIHVPSRGPNWVKTGKTQNEQMISGLPPIADAARLMSTPPARTPPSRLARRWHSRGSGVRSFVVAVGERAKRKREWDASIKT